MCLIAEAVKRTQEYIEYCQRELAAMDVEDSITNKHAGDKASDTFSNNVAKRELMISKSFRYIFIFLIKPRSSD